MPTAAADGDQLSLRDMVVFFASSWSSNGCTHLLDAMKSGKSGIEEAFGIKTNVKIVYFTQLLGLALGLSARKVALHENVSDSIDFLHEKGVI